MKCGIEAGDLRHAGEPGGDGFDQSDSLRQMFGGEVNDLPQIVQQRGADKLRIE